MSYLEERHTEGFLRLLQACPNLESIEIESSRLSAFRLPALPRLRKLVISSTFPSSPGADHSCRELEGLAAQPALTHLHITDCCFVPKQLTPSLASLSVCRSSCPKPEDPVFRAFAASCISSLPHITELSLRNCGTHGPSRCFIIFLLLSHAAVIGRGRGSLVCFLFPHIAESSQFSPIKRLFVCRRHEAHWLAQVIGPAVC